MSWPIRESLRKTTDDYPNHLANPEKVPTIIGYCNKCKTYTIHVQHKEWIDRFWLCLGCGKKVWIN